MPYREMTRDRAWLMPPTVDELIPADHPARFVAEFVDTLDREEWADLGVDINGEAMGAPAYHPSALHPADVLNWPKLQTQLRPEPVPYSIRGCRGRCADSRRPRVRRRGDQTQPSDLCPTTGAINSNQPDGCPAGEGPTSNFSRRTEPRTEALASTPSIGPRWLRRTNVKLRIASIPSWAKPVHQGSRTQVIYGRKPWRKPNSEVIIADLRGQKDPLRAPTPEIAPKRPAQRNLSDNHNHRSVSARHRTMSGPCVAENLLVVIGRLKGHEVEILAPGQGTLRPSVSS